MNSFSSASSAPSQLSAGNESSIDVPLRIGPLDIAPRLLLAPMSGVTNSAFRRLIKSENPGAVGLVVTEFISIEALTRENRRSLDMMLHRPEERPLSIQIFGHSIQRMVDSAKMVQDAGADILDINCGCPVPRVVKRGGGAELMRQSAHLGSILKAVSKAISIPLTLKIRSGWDESSRNALEVARIAEDSGVQLLTIHGRTRKDLYRGSRDWEFIGDIARAVKIPVVGSGDIVDVPSAVAALETGVAGLMIGRGALMNPWIFSEIRAGLLGLDFQVPPDIETVSIIEKYAELLEEDLPEKAIIGKLKQLCSQVTRRVRGSKIVRKELCRAGSVAELRGLLVEWREYLFQRDQALLGSYKDSSLEAKAVLSDASNYIPRPSISKRAAV